MRSGWIGAIASTVCLVLALNPWLDPLATFLGKERKRQLEKKDGKRKGAHHE
jgi:hypothetical protein